MKLIELPVLTDVLMYLGDDVLDVGLVSKDFHKFLTEDAGMKMFWYRQLRRMAHRKVDNKREDVWWSGWLRYYDVNNCYKDVDELPLSLKNIREEFGECQHDSHLRYKINLLDDEGFKSRDVYNEWRVVAWKRMKQKYWNKRDEKKVHKIQEQLAELNMEMARLSQKKSKSIELEGIYGNLKVAKKKKKTQTKTKKNKAS